MQSRLFLYIDILGFSDLILHTEQVERLYAIVDKAALFRDSSHRAIVFSDTIVAYNIHPDLSEDYKAQELMFLIELTQELFLSLIGSGIFFRAVITEGPFHHSKLKNLDAFYGQALVNAYRVEKGLIGTGLFLDRRLQQFNDVFRWHTFSPQLDFIYLTNFCSLLVDRVKDFDFPLPSIVEGVELENLELFEAGDLFPEIIHFGEIHQQMNAHPNPDVRAKYLATWNMYSLGYPKLMRSLTDHAFAPESVANLDWTEAKRLFDENRV